MTKLQATLDLIREYRGSWPAHITSGVIFNWGHRITIDDFLKYAGNVESVSVQRQDQRPNDQ